MGTVWQARGELLSRDVAVKEIVPPPYFSDAEQETARRRTVRKAQMAAGLRHPNVVGTAPFEGEGALASLNCRRRRRAESGPPRGTCAGLAPPAGATYLAGPKPNPLADWEQQQANRERNGVLVHILNRNILANS